MKNKPNFIRTVHPDDVRDLNFDINVMFIVSHEPYDSNLSKITVSGCQHFVFTSELRDMVSLPDHRGY